MSRHLLYEERQHEKIINFKFLSAGFKFSEKFSLHAGAGLPARMGPL
jgi:hypothetical protein